jgi:hypothetical protein
MAGKFSRNQIKRASQLCLAASDVRRKPRNWSFCSLARFVVTTNLDLFGLDLWPEADSAAVMEQKNQVFSVYHNCRNKFLYLVSSVHYCLRHTFNRLDWLSVVSR